MIDAETVGQVLAKCSAYAAQHTPTPSDIVIDAWLEHFEFYPNVTRADLLAAVREYFTVPRTEQLQPVHLSAIARKYARERYERSDLDSVERRRHEAICDAKSAPELAAIESAAHVRQAAVISFAQRFGVSPTEAAVRMGPDQGTRNELDARLVEVTHRRMASPPLPVPCPDCHSTDVPCGCDLNVT